MNNSNLNLEQAVPVINYISQHWVWLLIMLVVLLLLLYFFIIPFLFKMVRRGKNVAESSNLKKDLMVWRNLSNLVQGGKEEADAKQNLSGKLEIINILFQQCLDLIKQSRHKKYDIPWFILLGEPQSGKSTIMKNSGLELVCSTPRGGSQLQKKESFPLCGWLGNKAFVLDIAGRVFFDRWLNGSSAEWHYVINLLKRKHHRKILDGAIIVIPADALLADDESLCREKASLITSELSELVLRTGMNIPCHIVISKMDMILGFREYFSALNEKEVAQIFGWQNLDSSGSFNQECFHEYWDKTVTSLRNNVPAQLLNAKFFTDKEIARNRIDISGKIYSFPEEFNKIQENLTIYLSHIFGNECWCSSSQTVLSGVFFTSSQDNAVVLSREFAQLNGKPMEEAVIKTAPAVNSCSYFIKLLLRDWIFAGKIPATYTAKELAKRQIPAYLLAVLILALGTFWLLTGCFGGKNLKNMLTPFMEHYKAVADDFSNRNIDKSPIISVEKNGPVLYADKEMAGNPHYSRLQYLYLSQSNAHNSIYAPLGFRLASLIMFNGHFDLGYADRQFVLNQIQTEMVYLPLIRSTQKLIGSWNNNEFTRIEGEAMFNYAEIPFSDEKKGTPSDSFLLMLFPDMPADTLKLLQSYNHYYNPGHKETSAKIIYDYSYSEKQKIWFGKYFKALEKLAVYNETFYPMLRKILRNGVELRQIQEEILSLGKNLPASVAESGKILAQWRNLLDRQRKKSQEISRSIYLLMHDDGYKNILNNSVSDKVNSKKTGGAINFLSPELNIVKAAETDYKNKIKHDQEKFNSYFADLNFLQKKGKIRNNLIYLDPQETGNRFKDAMDKLSKEATELSQQRNLLFKSYLFSFLTAKSKSEKADISVSDCFLFEAIDELNKIICSLGPVKKMNSCNEFIEAWDSFVRQSAAVTANFEKKSTLYADDEHLAAVIAVNRELLSRQIKFNRFEMAADLLDIYPKSVTDFSSIIAKSALKENSVFQISPLLTGESIGALSVSNGYSPKVAMRFLEPLDQLLKYIATDKKNSKIFKESLKQLAKVEKMAGDYLDEYIKYWGSYGDNLSLKFNSWGDFQKRCGSVKAYEVNTLLFLVYKNTEEILNRIPQNILSPKQKKLCGSYLAEIGAKMQILTPHFSEICSRQLSSWAVISSDPGKAFSFINSVPEKELISSYFAVISPNSKAEIPWWSKFFKNGISVLKLDVSKQTLNIINQDFSLMRFPICADAVEKTVLDVSDLKKIQLMLQSLGFSPVAGKDNKENKEKLPEIISSLNLFDTLDNSAQQWGSNVLGIADALVNNNKPLVWTLTIPEAKEQKKLSGSFYPELPLAIYRYRYAELWSNKERKNLRQMLFVNTNIVFGRGNGSDSNIAVRLYEFSGDEKTSAEYVLPGKWAILRLYLTKNSYVDPERKTIYIPLIIRDKAGAASVLWLGLQFNKQLPYPNQWPSTNNWPDFSPVQKKIKQNRAQPANNWINLLSSAKSYDELKNTLLSCDLKSYPEIEIFIPGNTGFALKNRYAEMVIPGVPSKRVAISPEGVSLGKVSLTTPELTISFYKHAAERKPAGSIKLTGPYAPLRMFAVPGKSFKDGKFLIPYSLGKEKFVIELKAN